MFAAPELRQDTFWGAFINQALHQPYELSLKVPKSPEPKMVLTCSASSLVRVSRDQNADAI